MAAVDFKIEETHYSGLGIPSLGLFFIVLLFIYFALTALNGFFGHF